MDTTTRGGDQSLTIVDLIISLRRVTGVDPSRPRRSSRNITPCPPPSAGLETLRLQRSTTESGASGEVGGAGDSGALELGGALASENGTFRIPVYLRAGRRVALAGLSFSLGLAGGGPLRFVAVEGRAPSLLDDGVPGVLALAWLNGFTTTAGGRTLLGFVETAEGAAALEVYGLSAEPDIQAPGLQRKRPDRELQP